MTSLEEQAYSYYLREMIKMCDFGRLPMMENKAEMKKELVKHAKAWKRILEQMEGKEDPLSLEIVELVKENKMMMTEHCEHELIRNIKFCVCCEIANKVCSGCNEKLYCSKSCQELDWPTHRQNCREIREIKKQLTLIKKMTSKGKYRNDIDTNNLIYEMFKDALRMVIGAVITDEKTYHTHLYLRHIKSGVIIDHLPGNIYIDECNSDEDRSMFAPLLVDKKFDEHYQQAYHVFPEHVRFIQKIRKHLGLTD